MTKHTTIVVWSTIGVCVTLLLLLSAFGQSVTARPLGQGCDPPCWGVYACKPVDLGIECSFTCHCPPGSTPGAPGGVTPIVTPFVWTPEPTPIPPPPNCQDICAREDCPEGETRLTRFCHDPVLGTLYVAVYLEECCGPSCPCGEPTEEEQPCTPGTETVCSEWGASVRAGLPAWPANREPYPRALVTLPEEVWVSDAAGNPTTVLPSVEVWGSPVDPGGDDCDCRDDDSCDDDPPPEGTVCEFKLGLRADPGNEPPTWSFEDCGSTIGWSAQCTWNRSSWGKPELGVGMAPDCPALPAYAVHATVPYWWSFARQWEQWEAIGTEWSDCFCRPEGEPLGIPHQGCGADACGECSGWCGRIGIEQYGWKHHGPDWVLLDLTDYGWPTPYMLNPNVQMIPHPPCEPNPPVGVIYVPCIEVQAPIEKQP